MTPIVKNVVGSTYPDAVEDIIQEAAFAASQNLKYFKANSSLQTWLFKIAYRKTIDFIRSVKKQENTINEDADLDDILNTQEGIEGSQTAEDALISVENLQNSFKGLTERERLMLTLFHIEDYSIREIADLLSTKEVSIRVELFRAREKARKNSQKRFFKKK